VYEEVKRRPLYIVDQVVRGSIGESVGRPVATSAELHR
jgi:hypothetical protein